MRFRFLILACSNAIGFRISINGRCGYELYVLNDSQMLAPEKSSLLNGIRRNTQHTYLDLLRMFLQRMCVRKNNTFHIFFMRTTTFVPSSRDVFYHASQSASSSNPSTYISQILDFDRKIFSAPHVYSFMSILCSQVHFMFQCTQKGIAQWKAGGNLVSAHLLFALNV